MGANLTRQLGNADCRCRPDKRVAGVFGAVGEGERRSSSAGHVIHQRPRTPETSSCQATPGIHVASVPRCSRRRPWDSEAGQLEYQFGSARTNCPLRTPSSPISNSDTDIKTRRSAPGEAERPCGESCGRRFCRTVSDYPVGMSSSWSFDEAPVFTACWGCDGIHSSVNRLNALSRKRSLQQCFSVS